jgi:beta-lactamase class A
MTRRLLLAAFALLAIGCSSSAPAATTETTASTSTSTTTSEPSTTTPAAPSTLQAIVDEFADAQAVPFSIVAVDLDSGERAARLSNRRVRSASLYKLFVARELLRRIDAGTLSREAPANDGKGRTIGQCLEAMIVVSDNACGVAGLNIVGRGALDAGLHDDGFVDTSLASPQRTSADDIALFFSQARDGTLLGAGGEDVTAELYDLLQRQQVNDRLPLGLPPGTPIAHKTGDIRQWAHDAGIITTPTGDVLLAVLSGPWPSPCCDADHPGAAEAKAFGAIADLASAVYTATE